MTKQDLRDYVRNFLDTDSIDLPDPLLDVFLAEATDSIARSSQRWSFYETEWSFSTVAAQSAYPLTGASGVATDASTITSVQGPRWQLAEIGHQAARLRYAFTNQSSQPREWSVWSNAIELWPVPNAVYSMVVTGYRKPLTSIGTADTPDVPEEFHPIIAKLMLASAFMQQDDAYTNQVLTQEAESQIQNIRGRYESVQHGGPSVLGGHPPSTYPSGLGRLLFDFE